MRVMYWPGAYNELSGIELKHEIQSNITALKKTF